MKVMKFAPWIGQNGIMHEGKGVLAQIRFTRSY